EVLLVRGVGDAISQGTVVARVANASETAAGVVTISWPQAIQTVQNENYYLAVRMPAGAGKRGAGNGAAIGAARAEVPGGSFVAGGSDGALTATNADLAMTLLTRTVGKTTPDSPEKVLRTFLAAATPNPTIAIARIHFGLMQQSQVRLGVYDVGGRR